MSFLAAPTFRSCQSSPRKEAERMKSDERLAARHLILSRSQPVRPASTTMVASLSVFTSWTSASAMLADA